MKKLVSYLYWALPVILLIPQIIFTLRSMNQIRYEELAESVRNVFWLQHRFVYDGSSSNIGWHAALLLFYKFFGYSLFSAKYFRLFLQIISLFSLAKLMSIFLGKRFGWLPLVIIGLSPTILYFNTSQTTFGTDLQMFPICLLLLVTLSFKKEVWPYIQQALLWMLVILASMFYPAFLFYVPALIILYLRKLFRECRGNTRLIATSLSTSFIVFLLPMLIGVLIIKNNTVLVYDPVTKSGLLRGSGSFLISQTHFKKNFSSIIQDFFISGKSYNFELAKSEFSNLYPLFTLAITFGLTAFFIMKKKSSRFPILLILVTILGTFFLVSISNDPSKLYGMRRNTSILVGIYLLISVIWFYTTRNLWHQTTIRYVATGALLLLFFHHLLVLPINLRHISDTSLYADTSFPKSSPADFLKEQVKKSQLNDLQIGCNGKYCRYQEIYAAIEGYCLWNKLSCHDIYGYDYHTDKYIKLSPEIWIDYYFPH